LSNQPSHRKVLLPTQPTPRFQNFPVPPLYFPSPLVSSPRRRFPFLFLILLCLVTIKRIPCRRQQVFFSATLSYAIIFFHNLLDFSPLPFQSYAVFGVQSTLGGGPPMLLYRRKDDRDSLEIRLFFSHSSPFRRNHPSLVSR